MQEEFVADLKSRVKDLRRPKKSQLGGVMKVYTYCKEPNPKKRKLIEVTQDGEDQESFTWHNRFLQAEYRKVKPNMSSVRQMMDLLQVYPFLQERKEVSNGNCK